MTFNFLQIYIAILRQTIVCPKIAPKFREEDIRFTSSKLLGQTSHLIVSQAYSRYVRWV